MITVCECFCLNCGCKQPYRVKSQTVRMIVRGIEFFCPEETAVCAICANEVYAPEVNDRNRDSRVKAFWDVVEREAAALDK